MDITLAGTITDVRTSLDVNASLLIDWTPSAITAVPAQE
jgi:hypothetical protein